MELVRLCRERKVLHTNNEVASCIHNIMIMLLHIHISSLFSVATYILLPVIPSIILCKPTAYNIMDNVYTVCLQYYCTNLCV